MRHVNCNTFFVLLVVMLAIALLPTIKAEIQTLGTFKLDSCVNLIQTCGNCTYVNVTVSNNTADIILSNKAMTKTDTVYNYSFCNTSSTGQYIYNTKGNPNGITTTQPVDFYITHTGRNPVSDVTFVFFYVLLAVVFGAFFVFASYNILFFFNLKWKDGKPQDIYGLNDILFNWIGYFVLLFFFFIYNYYIAEPLIVTILTYMLYMAVFTNLFLSVIAFMISMVYFGLNNILKSMRIKNGKSKKL